MQHDYFKKNGLTFELHQEVEGVSMGKIFATMLQHASSALIGYGTWLYLEKKFYFGLGPTA